MTFDFHDNEHQDVATTCTDRAAEIAKAMKRARDQRQATRKGHYSIVPYQTTHNTGGTIMGERSADERRQPLPAELGRAERVRDRRAAFPQNAGYNPTGTVGALDLLGARRHQEAVPEESRDRWCSV